MYIDCKTASFQQPKMALLFLPVSVIPGEDFEKPATRHRYKSHLFDNENPIGIFKLECISMCLSLKYRNSFSYNTGKFIFLPLKERRRRNVKHSISFLKELVSANVGK